MAGPILFVAELGGGFGHVRRLLPVAEAAARAGHRPLFLVPNPAEATAFVTRSGFGLRPAPSIHRAPASRPAGSVAASFADILGGAGFADVDYLHDRAKAWDATIDEVRPAAIVCEFSPFLNVAVFGGAIPVLVLGHGFVLPPPQLPAFVPLWDGAPLFEASRLLAHVAQVCARRARPTPPSLPAILGGTAHAVTGLAQLDPYRARRARPAVGPPSVEARLAETDPRHDVFAYLLGDSPSTMYVLRALGLSGLRGRVFVRRGGEAHRRLVDGTGMTWLDKPEPIRSALDQARVIVHHGSMLTSEEALVAGRPQVVVPLYLEHLLTARALAELGVAAIVRSARDPEDIARALAAGLADDAVARNARAFAERFWRESAPAPDLPDQLLRGIL